MDYRTRGGEVMHMIDSERFRALMDVAEPVEYGLELTSNEGAEALEAVIEAEKWPVVEMFDSGRGLEWGCDEWEQQAYLYEWTEGWWLLEVRECFLGEEHTDPVPNFYEVPKSYF